jgi:ubiquinone/menaquinone biosynthesis C-methylase UbiE
MDAPGLPEAEVAEAYRVLRRVNVQLGNRDAARGELRRMLTEDGPWGEGQAPSLLDVGSGSGDLPCALRDGVASRGGRLQVVALDRELTAAHLARRDQLDVVRGDALRLPFADASVDLVMAVKFAHHFSGDPLTRLVAEMARVSRRRVLVLDIRRHWFAYYGFIAWSRVFTRNRLVRHDGPLSVLRGFTAAELAALGESITTHEWTVRPYLGFQLALVGCRRARPSTST